MLVKLSTDKTVTEAATALQAAVQANHFGVMHVHNLKETMNKKGVEFNHECLFFEVCHPQQAKKVLEQDMSVSTALPCRISIYEEEGKTVLATLKPNHPSGNVQRAATGRGGAGCGKQHCQNYEGGGIKLIGHIGR
jgi:uncharacterized protein (DUF302 family)